MSGTKDIPTKRSTEELDGVTKEKLGNTGAELTSFFFHHGANVYVFSYQKEGIRRHTFIDSGDSQYRNQISTILVENDINPANIERIIITHRHPDHCGLAALLAKESGAKIVVHSNFRSFVEGAVRQEERGWMGNFNPFHLRECNIEYLSQPERGEARIINGVDFPILDESIEIGEAGKLKILACPENTSTHSPDQIIILYSPKSCPDTGELKHQNLRPTDDILFSGDLWLMRGPRLHWDAKNFSRHLKYGVHRMKNLVSNKNSPRRDPREQDSQTKEALKKGFHLIRVKPGHGEDFIGSSIIPSSLLADRDMLLALGYSLGTNKAVLRQPDIAPKVAALREQAYTNFIKEVLYWKELGYTPDEISALLVRIYKEQSGGGPLAGNDRKERRARIKETLSRLEEDKAESEELHQLAKMTLSKVQKVL